MVTIGQTKSLKIEMNERFIYEIDCQRNTVIWWERRVYTENKRDIHVSIFDDVSNTPINWDILVENDVTKKLSYSEYAPLIAGAWYRYGDSREVIKCQWRRFKVIKPKFEDDLKLKKKKKGITRDDLILILSTLELRKEYKV